MENADWEPAGLGMPSRRGLPWKLIEEGSSGLMPIGLVSGTSGPADRDWAVWELGTDAIGGCWGTIDAASVIPEKVSF